MNLTNLTFQVLDNIKKKPSREMTVTQHKTGLTVSIEGTLNEIHVNLEDEELLVRFQDGIVGRAIWKFANNQVSCKLQPPASHWDNDEEYPVEDWAREVSEDNTRLGYIEWVEHQRESNS